jgi:hypothetical protein
MQASKQSSANILHSHCCENLKYNSSETVEEMRLTKKLFKQILEMLLISLLLSEKTINYNLHINYKRRLMELAYDQSERQPLL